MPHDKAAAAMSCESTNSDIKILQSYHARKHDRTVQTMPRVATIDQCITRLYVLSLLEKTIRLGPNQKVVILNP